MIGADHFRKKQLQRVMSLLRPLMAETIGDEFSKMPARELIRMEDELLFDYEKLYDSTPSSADELPPSHVASNRSPGYPGRIAMFLLGLVFFWILFVIIKRSIGQTQPMQSLLVVVVYLVAFAVAQMCSYYLWRRVFTASVRNFFRELVRHGWPALVLFMLARLMIPA